MRAQTLRWTLLWLGATLMVATSGCGSGGDNNTSSAASGTTSSSSSSSGGEGGAGGGGGGGAGGGGNVDNGHSASETVAAGETAKSANYKMTFTFGQPTQNQGKTASPSYNLQGGLAGANGSNP